MDEALDMPEPASAAVVPLTRLSLSALKPATKRKRSAPETASEVSSSNTPVTDNAPTETGNEPVRYAPLKKARRVKEKSLLDTLGLSTTKSEYISSKSYIGSRSDREIVSRSDLSDLKYTIILIEKCTGLVDDSTPKRLGDLRTRIHAMEIQARFHNQLLIQASKILEENGLRRLFESEGVVVPWDIRADATALYSRWSRGELDSSLMRGIEIERKARSTHYKIEESYKDKLITANAVGCNGLVNGQWWPMRVCAFRDGAHGEREAGIHGKAGIGAYSIVLASGGYADKDLGDVIHYCGTASETPTPTVRTSFLRSTILKHPIRVLRAVFKKSTYAPVEGIRYDGLYTITSEELLDANTAMYRFKLERVAGQDPIRYKGVEKRPTREEVEEKGRVWRTFSGRDA